MVDSRPPPPPDRLRLLLNLLLQRLGCRVSITRSTLSYILSESERLFVD